MSSTQNRTNFYYSINIFAGQWTQNATKARMFTCRHTQHIQHIHMIVWHYQIQENACLVRISNIQRQVRMKNDVFKHLVVFQKHQYLQEGIEFIIFLT